MPVRKTLLVDLGPRPLSKLPTFLYPPAVETASSAQEPKAMPSNATDEPSKKPWLYRVLRREEFPRELRNPPDTRDLSKGDEILVFKADGGKPKAPVRALRIQVGSLMKRQAMAAHSSKKR